MPISTVLPTPGPIVEQITAAIVTSLSRVKVSNGYSRDLNVIRCYSLPAAQDDMTGVLIPGDPVEDENPANLDSNKYVYRILPFVLMIYIREPEQSATSVDQRANYAGADAEKALMVTARLGGLIDRDIRIRAPELFLQSEGGIEVPGIGVKFNVPFRSLRSNPYAAS